MTIRPVDDSQRTAARVAGFTGLFGMAIDCDRGLGDAAKLSNCHRIARDGERSKERVDEWGQCRAGQKNERAEQKQHDQDWQQPPFLVLKQVGPQIADQTSTRYLGSRSLKLIFRFGVHGWLLVNHDWSKYLRTLVGIGLIAQYEPSSGHDRRRNRSRPVSLKKKATGVKTP